MASWPMAAAGIGLAVCGALFSLWIDQRVETVLNGQVAAVVEITLDTAEAGVRLPLAAAARAARAAASDPELQLAAAGCAESACDALEVVVRPYLAQGGFTHFGLADRAGRLRAGTLAAAGLPQLSAAMLEAAGSGRLRAVAERVANEPFLFMLVPDRSGTWVFGLPNSAWTEPLRVARIGRTGETYAFDRAGRLLSESRFEPVLRSAGLLAADAPSAVLGFQLKDPGVSIHEPAELRPPRATQPLTHSVRAAISGVSAVETTPYRDYRGVWVVGAYRFLAEFDLGLACEIDQTSAFQAIETLQMMLKWLVGALSLSALALLAVATISARLRRHVQTAERLVARFGQYRLVRKIGEGGMGAVYLASHEMLRRPAAIKLLRPDRTSPEAIARFEREVRVTATLKHPNTVAVYDYGRTERGDLFYVMEYLEGLDLQNLVARFGPMPSARVLHYLRQLCGSLAEAHAARLVHRDIKPANLLACRVGGVPDTLKVVDFGVAKTLVGEALGLTVDRVLLGTPEYMAPELFESAERASRQSDLYSVGAVAYFLLTGQTVFEAKSLTELSLAQLTRTHELPSTRLQAAVDPVLESAVMACLAKRPQQRPASARSLATMLERSTLASAWTMADAESWWNAHSGELDALRVSREPASPVPELTRIRPVT
jgi:hypothetical protein